MGEPGGRLSMGSHRVGHNWSNLAAAAAAVSYDLLYFWVVCCDLSIFIFNFKIMYCLQSSPTLCDPIDGSPRGSPIPGILQARTLEWVAISFSNAWKWKVKVKSLSRVRRLATPWTEAYQAPSSMGFSRQEYWSGVQTYSVTFWEILDKNISLELE